MRLFEKRMDGIIDWINEEEACNPDFKGHANTCELMDLTTERFRLETQEFGLSEGKKEKIKEKYGEICSKYNPFEAINAIENFRKANPKVDANPSELVFLLSCVDQIPLMGDEFDYVRAFAREGLISLNKTNLFENKTTLFENKVDPMFRLIRELTSQATTPKKYVKATKNPLFPGLYAAKTTAIYNYIMQNQADANFVYDNYDEFSLLLEMRRSYFESIQGKQGDAGLVNQAAALEEMFSLITSKYKLTLGVIERENPGYIHTYKRTMDNKIALARERQ